MQNSWNTFQDKFNYPSTGFALGCGKSEQRNLEQLINVVLADCLRFQKPTNAKPETARKKMKDNMEILPEIEDYEVLCSGTIITVPGKKITFRIKDIVFELYFENNNDLPDHKISFEIPDGTKIMKILFENFNNSLGIGNTKPLPVGFLENKTLFFNYRIYALDTELGKTFNYTWYLGEKEGGQDGE